MKYSMLLSSILMVSGCGPEVSVEDCKWLGETIGNNYSIEKLDTHLLSDKRDVWIIECHDGVFLSPIGYRFKGHMIPFSANNLYKLRTDTSVCDRDYLKEGVRIPIPDLTIYTNYLDQLATLGYVPIKEEIDDVK